MTTQESVIHEVGLIIGIIGISEVDITLEMIEMKVIKVLGIERGHRTGTEVEIEIMEEDLIKIKVRKNQD